MLIFFLSFISLFFCFGFNSIAEEYVGKSKEPVETLYLVPFDGASSDILKQIGEALKKQLPLNYKILPSIKAESGAFNSHRRQYFSSKLLEQMRKQYSFPNGRILGVIDYDLYVPQLNFVFGEADIDNKCAIISITRLRQEFYSVNSDNKLFFKRVITEAVHELGHTYGLQHCRDKYCVMFFSNSLRDTDRKGFNFCQSCLKNLQHQFK